MSSIINYHPIQQSLAGPRFEAGIGNSSDFVEEPLATIEILDVPNVEILRKKIDLIATI